MSNSNSTLLYNNIYLKNVSAMRRQKCCVAMHIDNISEVNGDGYLLAL